MGRNRWALCNVGDVRRVTVWNERVVKKNIKMTGYPDTNPEMAQQYSACVVFLAAWLLQQDGAGGKDTAELFDEFKANVCDVMKGEPGGTG